jgi:hypothetical protein
LSVIYDESDFKYQKFKAFIYGILIGYLIRLQKQKSSSVFRSNKGGRSIHKNRCLFYPVTNLAISEFYGVSLATASRMKKIASKHNFIVVKPNYSLISDQIGYLKHIKAANPDIAHRLIKKKGGIFIQNPDSVHEDFIFGKRKKVNT